MHLSIIGYGSIARAIATWLAERPVTALTVLVRSSAIGNTLHDTAISRAADAVQITDDLDTVIESAPDLVVECAGHTSVADHCPRLLAAGIDVVMVSVGALADDTLLQRVQEAAGRGGAQLILPSGAIGGIDLLSALALAGAPEVRYRGTKPPAAWRGTAAEQICDLSYLTQPKTVFQGSARDAAQMYPKNANVVATLALACGSFDRTEVQLIADPQATCNSHSYDVMSDSGHVAMQIENAVSSGNAKTSVATAFSVIREINRKRDPLVI